HDANRPIDLDGGEPGPVRVAHGLDQVVDELLNLLGSELFRADLFGALAEDGVADLGDFQQSHARRLARHLGKRVLPSVSKHEASYVETLKNALRTGAILSGVLVLLPQASPVI